MGPDTHRHQPDGQRGRHHEGVPKDDLARKDRDDLRRVGKARDHQDIDLGVAKEPEEMLPENRVPARLGIEEMGAQEAIKEQHDLGARQDRQRQKHQERNHQHHPNEKREPAHRHARATHGQRRGEHVDRPGYAAKAADQDAENPVVRGIPARKRFARKRRVREPPHIGCRTRTVEPHAREIAHIEHESPEEEHPEPPGVEPGKGHIPGTDHERDQVVPETRHDGHPHQEDHGGAVHGEEPVEFLGFEQVVGGLGQLGAHHDRLDAADHEKEQARRDIENAQLFMIDRGDPCVQDRSPALRPRYPARCICP